ncbi:unnamed protein product [Knipowitschia caucasica]|uniref:Period circadian protein homolog 2 n=1 Tax=Knipowitschia caucasica TaxID=637954 RepID=A0AAV2JTT4_KNICA
MSEDSDCKPYRRPELQEAHEPPSCSSMHRMAPFGHGGGTLGLPSEGSDSSGQGNSTSQQNHSKNSRSRSLPKDDLEMKSSGSSGSGTESHGNESHSNGSSNSSSLSHSKDSALLESSGSNKSSNSHSPSPPSSSNTFSLLSSEQDHPSTSGCSSQESAKAKTQKEILKTLKELKRLLPTEKRHSHKSTTVNTLKYALRCVKQVEANEEYYQLSMTNDSQPSGVDVSAYTIEEIDIITSEYTLKNNDIFAVAVSLATGRIVYISDQAANILNCKRDAFKDSKFVEFLSPQDVSVFYSFTTPYRLPSWSMCTGADSSPSDCMQEKSFFCRISGGKECEGDVQFYPFRMTPYLMKVQDALHPEDQFCCLLLAERVHSGYDAPRIPTDKRIFTTTHSPSCVFQDVDERAVPLLGYLPQDLIGTPVLLHLHPHDRPIMLAVHRKILQCAGKPFDHSSIRFCARNGEYVTLDTSWSTFVNPWSRKVSFIIGRHKVRMGPVNEDVFVAPACSAWDMKTMDPEIQELTEQIHRLLLQPVLSTGSSGYGNINSNDHLIRMTSPTESYNNGSNSKMLPDEEEQICKARPRTFQEICKYIHLQKCQVQQTVNTDKKSSESVQKNQHVVRTKDSVQWKDSVDTKSAFLEDQAVHSYQQISCLDSVIRYLESCNIPLTVKRKCQSVSHSTSSNSEEDKQKVCTSIVMAAEPALLNVQSDLSTLRDQDKKLSAEATAVADTPLPLPVPNRAESVVSITSQCSYSSTIVHVGDKKPLPETEFIEDIRGTGEPDSSQIHAASPCGISSPSQEMESYKILGLTKQVLAAHTQKEELAFLNRFQEPSTLNAHTPNCSQYLEGQREQTSNDVVQTSQSSKQCDPGVKRSMGRRARTKKYKSKRAMQVASSDSTASHSSTQHQPPLFNHQIPPLSWPPSEAAHSCFPLAYPAEMPGYPLPVYPDSVALCTDAGASVCGANLGPPAAHMPVLALILPNYMYPPVAPMPVPSQPMYPTMPSAPSVFSPHGAFASPFKVQGQSNLQNPNHSHAGSMTMSFHPSPSSELPNRAVQSQSRPSTPQSVDDGDEGNSSPALFQSPCSSPLNLLDLELSVQDCTGTAALGPGHNNTTERSGNHTKDRDLVQPSLSLLGPPGPCVYERLSWDKLCSRLEASSCEISSRGDGNNSDANSLSSDMLDVILHEDSLSGTGSATSGSMGSASRGCGTSSGTSSGTSNSRTSNSGASACGISGSDSSKYFGSVDSSQSSQKAKVPISSNEGSLSEMDPAEHIAKYVLQDPMWLLMSNTEDKVMMNYQLPSRDVQQVLKEYSDKIQDLQKSQPCFTEEQKKELGEVHPWIRSGHLPSVIDIKECSCCEEASEVSVTAEAGDGPDMEMGDTEVLDWS